jgi:plasmid maintenance system killer protein
VLPDVAQPGSIRVAVRSCHRGLFCLPNRLIFLRGYVRLEVFFEDSRLGQTLESDRDLQRRYGTERAKKLRTRLSALRAAGPLADLRHAPGRCHELTGNYAGLLSLDLDGPYRLYFRPHEETDPKPGGGLDWTKVTAVVVTDVVDPH